MILTRPKSARHPRMAKGEMETPKKSMSIDIEMVRALAGVLTDAGLSEIEYDAGDWRVRVTRAPAALAATPFIGAAGAALIGGPPAAAATAPVVEAVAAPTRESLAGHPGLLSSPMVGIAYTSPDPGSPPFVSVGDQVSEGTTVLLIEAMKVFNPIKAHRSGRIDRIFVDGQTPVEYGEPLLLIL